MAEITFVIPARNLDTLHRTLSMLSFQKDAALGKLRRVFDAAAAERNRFVFLFFGDLAKRLNGVEKACIVSGFDPDPVFRDRKGVFFFPEIL